METYKTRKICYYTCLTFSGWSGIILPDSIITQELRVDIPVCCTHYTFTGPRLRFTVVCRYTAHDYAFVSEPVKQDRWKTHVYQAQWAKI